MTDKTDPIAHAARLLREAAQELQQGHTLRTTPNDWTGEPEAKAAYDEHMGAAAALECWAEAIGAGGVSPLMGKPQEMPDLTTLTERGAKAWAGVDAQGLRDGAASAGSEPVAAIHWPIGGPPRLMWHSNAALHAAIRKAHEGHQSDVPLYLHPSPPEGMVGGWMPIETAPKGELVLLWSSVKRGEPFIGDWADYMRWNQPRFTHWSRWIPTPPTSSADSRKGE